MTPFPPPKSTSDLLLLAYRVRPCYQCGVIGPCVHREPEVELAYIEAERFKLRMPITRETRRAKHA